VPRATRDRLFWTVCLPARTALGAGALAIGYAAPQLLRWVGLYALFTALGLAANAVRAALGHKTHGGFGGRVWWTRARYVHATLWATCAALAFARVPWAGALVLADVAVGAATARARPESQNDPRNFTCK